MLGRAPSGCTRAQFALNGGVGYVRDFLPRQVFEELAERCEPAWRASCKQEKGSVAIGRRGRHLGPTTEAHAALMCEESLLFVSNLVGAFAPRVGALHSPVPPPEPTGGRSFASLRHRLRPDARLTLLSLALSQASRCSMATSQLSTGFTRRAQRWTGTSTRCCTLLARSTSSCTL